MMNTHSDRYLHWCIANDPERAEFWRANLGENKAPIKSPIPSWAMLPGLGEQLIYNLDLSFLNEEQEKRLIYVLAEKFNLDYSEAVDEFLSRGVPILAKDVTVFSKSLWFLD